MNTVNKLSTEQKAAQPLSLVSQQHSFVMFYIVCLQTEDSDAMKRAVAKLVRAYDRMIPEFANSPDFTELLINTRNAIVASDGNDIYSDMSRIYDCMNAHRLDSDVGNESESTYDEENGDDIDDVMEAIRKQIQDLQVVRTNIDH